MDLNCFKQLYASTFKPENLLSEFWTSFVYDAEGSLDDWSAMRKGIEENARNQRKVLKEMFDASFPPSEEDARQMEDADRALYVQLMDEYPELLVGNTEKYMWFK